MKSNMSSGDRLTNLMYKEITSSEVLSRDEEYALFVEHVNPETTEERKAQIRDTIVTANLRFALKSCLLYKSVPRVEIADMMTEAKIGLITAFDKYDHRKGIKFISFAVWHVRHAFSKYFDKIDTIRIPTHQKTNLNKIRKLKEVHEFDDKTAFFHNITQSPVSLDSSPLHDDDDECKLSDILVDESVASPEDEAYNYIVNKQLNDVIDSVLTSDEATVIRTIFGLNGSIPGGLNDASIAVNKSHERVRQLRDRALAKLGREEKIKQCGKLLMDYNAE